MNSLFGVELPTPVNFIIAFVVVLALIGAATWLVRRFGATRLDAAARSRQPRLAVLDSAAVDGRRKLVIIRRDNVEHLLMIGGPNDVVVESSIVRGAAPAAREAPAVRAADNLPRVTPLPDPNAWASPEPAPAPAPVVRVERERPRVVVDEPAAHWPPLQSEPEAPPVRAPRAEPRPAPQAAPARTAEALAGLAAELAKPAPAPEPRAAPTPQPRPAQLAPIEPAITAADKNLADMAQRLEEALRQPAPAASPEPKPQPAKPAAETRPEPKSSAPPTAPAKSQFETLEQEMANLLGRPGKT